MTNNELELIETAYLMGYEPSDDNMPMSDVYFEAYDYIVANQ